MKNFDEMIYQELVQENQSFNQQIEYMRSVQEKNREVMKRIISRQFAAIVRSVFSKRSKYQLKFDTALDRDISAALLESEPVKFIEKYLCQYPLAVIQSDFKGAYPLNYLQKFNAQNGKYKLIGPWMRIESTVFDGGQYDRDSCCTTISYNGKELTYSHNGYDNFDEKNKRNEKTWTIFRLLEKYYIDNVRNK